MKHDPYNQPARPPPDERDNPIPWDPSFNPTPGLVVREITMEEWLGAWYEWTMSNTKAS